MPWHSDSILRRLGSEAEGLEVVGMAPTNNRLLRTGYHPPLSPER